MNLRELMLDHQKQWKDFAEMRLREWEQIQKNNQAIRGAFGIDEAKLPDTVREKELETHSAWQTKWSPDGELSKNLEALQKRQMDDFLGKRRESIRQTFYNNNQFKKRANQNRER